MVYQNGYLRVFKIMVDEKTFSIEADCSNKHVNLACICVLTFNILMSLCHAFSVYDLIMFPFFNNLVVLVAVFLHLPHLLIVIETSFPLFLSPVEMEHSCHLCVQCPFMYLNLSIRLYYEVLPGPRMYFITKHITSQPFWVSV